MKKLIYLVIVTLLTLTSCGTQTYYVDNMYPQPRTNTTTVVTTNWGFYPYYNTMFWYGPSIYDPFWNPMWGWNNIYLNRWNIPYYPYHYVPRYTVAPRPSRNTPPTRYERRSESIYSQPRTVQPSRTRTENYNRVTAPSRTITPSTNTPSRNYAPSASPSRQTTPSRQYNTPAPSRNYAPSASPSRQATPSRQYNTPAPSRSNNNYTPSRQSIPSRSYSPAPSRRSGNN
jgi:hypothetical protein